MNKPTAVNMTGIQTPYGTKHDNIEIGDASIDYSNNDSGLIWYNSPDTAGKYVIFSAANDNGYMTATPLFWVCNQTDDELVRLVNGLPNRRGEIPFTTAIQATDWLASEPNYYLSEDAGGGGGGGAWYFYSDEGPLNVGPPINNGNAIFFDSNTNIETFNPNATAGSLRLHFCVKDSTGTDYTTQFNNQLAPGGKITIIQNGDYAAYEYTVAGSMFLDTIPGVGSFFMIQTNVASQVANASGSFNFNDPITLTFSL